MGMQFHIEGTEEFGYITFNRCLFSFYNLLNTVKRVCARYNNASVWDLNGYAAHFCYLRLKSFDTLLKVVKEQNDFISASCLLRMLGDSVAVFHLIYMEPDPDWRWLRHALYIIDGCERNMVALPENDMGEEALPENERKIFKEQNRQTEIGSSRNSKLIKRRVPISISGLNCMKGLRCARVMMYFPLFRNTLMV